jgi:predicted transcriptional regulator
VSVRFSLRHFKEIMHILWKLKSIRKRNHGRNHRTKNNNITTLSTIVRNLEERFCIAQCFWKSHQYYPIVSLGGVMKTLHEYIDSTFSSSYKNMVSHFAKRRENSAAELRNSIMIENKNKIKITVI